MRLKTFLFHARRAGLTVNTLTSGRIEVGKFNGRVWTIGVQIITDETGWNFWSAHRIDVAPEHALAIRTVREVAAVFSEYL
jgi:hypothetical protein